MTMAVAETTHYTRRELTALAKDFVKKGRIKKICVFYDGYRFYSIGADTMKVYKHTRLAQLGKLKEVGTYTSKALAEDIVEDMLWTLGVD